MNKQLGDITTMEHDMIAALCSAEKNNELTHIGIGNFLNKFWFWFNI